MRPSGRTRIDLLVTNASEVVTCHPAGSGRGARGTDLRALQVIPNGAVAVSDTRIVEVGSATELAGKYDARVVVDARQSVVSPGLVDAHTHLIHGGSRHEEFSARLEGRPVPADRGGIRATVAATTALSDSELESGLLARLDTMLAHGTTTAEVKTGYGIDPAEERRLLNVLARVHHDLDVVRTLLTGHYLPEELATDRRRAVELTTSQIGAARELADYLDVCCEDGIYTAEEVRSIAEVAAVSGVRMRIHADHLAWCGGAELAAEIGASSVDHLEHISDDGIQALAASDTVAVLFPSVTLHQRHLVVTRSADGERPPVHPGAPARFRELVAAGALVALSTDYNPGSSPALSLQLVMQLAARLYGFTVAEIWHMVTINAAVSLDRDGEIGSIAPGKSADLVVWMVPDHRMVIDSFGNNLVRNVLVRGELVQRNATRTHTRRPARPDSSHSGRR